MMCPVPSPANCGNDVADAPAIGRGTVGRLDKSARLESDLIDVTGLDLDQLDALPESVLADSLRRIFDEGEQMSDQFAIFKNSMP